MEKKSTLEKYEIDERNLLNIAERAKDFAVSKGIQMRIPDFPSDFRAPVSFCLTPTPFPKKWFDLAKKLQPYLNEVLHKLAYTPGVLKDALSSSLEVDDFTNNIYKIYEAVVDDDKQISLGIIRSDYLLNTNSIGQVIGMKQVEYNVIAASFGGLAPSVRTLHKFVLNNFSQTEIYKNEAHCLPHNSSAEGIAEGLVAAWGMYDCLQSAVLFVVEDITLNIDDQRSIEHKILDKVPKLNVLRRSFKELRNCITLSNRNKLYVNDTEIAVVYYRTGYVPEDYEPVDWETRLLIERSRAVKCPTAAMHLAGTKRVQLYLNRPRVLESFLEENRAKKLREVFENQYALDMGVDGDRAIQLGIQNPEKYILKPEREGGGNNLHGEEMKIFLEKIQHSKERSAYILMERIKPPIISNCIVRRGSPPKVTGVTSELGIYGTILGTKNGIHSNSVVGHLLRSKDIETAEVGIVAGFGALDSPYLE